MEAYMWIILASMLVMGVGIGFVIGRTKNDAINKIKSLEEELQTSREEMTNYRGEVVDHFGKTASLFNQLTNDYRAVHEHLAASSQSLCGDQVAKLTGSVPEKRLFDVDAEVTPEANEQVLEQEQEVAKSDDIEKQAQTEKDEVAESAEEAIKPSTIEEKAAEARTIH